MRLMQLGATKLVEHYRDRPQFKDFDAELVFGHAASDGMTRYIARETGVDLDRVRLCHGTFANTVSASIPLAMSHALRDGSLREGRRVLLMLASAGSPPAWRRSPTAARPPGSGRDRVTRGGSARRGRPSSATSSAS
jgi:hypothetical protein